MERRKFIALSSLAAVGFSLPLNGCKEKWAGTLEQKSSFLALTENLLQAWTDRMVQLQVIQPNNPELHGALNCPACDKIHGRCMDAVYPFMHMAAKTGDQKYLDAAIAVMAWSENVSLPDGSWTVIPDPKSWKGITVFGAIALGEALHHHGHLLSEDLKTKWTERLKKAAEFVYLNFTMDYSHVNYAFTAVYALNFFGRYFEDNRYLERSRELAAQVPNWLTEPNKLIYGEDSPADKKSKKGLLPVDLGYNVEETLNGLVLFAKLENDQKLIKVLHSSMNAHLEFMLPDGAWDNSWGTRQNKWSYWGSRTTDGCQPAFLTMADENPAFAKAAMLNTQLLKRCTVDGLLAGGLHYDSHGVKPCVHHTFAHAKSLAFVLDNGLDVEDTLDRAELPREKIKGIVHFPEIDVWLVSEGPWKATVSSYDNQFKKPYSQQATGGALAVLWHHKVGPIFMASMAEYILVEANNQQPQPDNEDIPLTPRIESSNNGDWYSNLFDLEAKVMTQSNSGSSNIQVATQLKNRERKTLNDSIYDIDYQFNNENVTIKVSVSDQDDNTSRLVLPIISKSGENSSGIGTKRIEIQKGHGRLVVESNAILNRLPSKKDRIFNMVPGFEALPIFATFDRDLKTIEVTIKII